MIRFGGCMKGDELMRLSTGSAGVDVVLVVEGDPKSSKVWLVLDHHANGTSEAAEIRLADMLQLRAALGTLIRSRKNEVK